MQISNRKIRNRQTHGRCSIQSLIKLEAPGPTFKTVPAFEGSNHLSHNSIFKEQRGSSSAPSVFTPWHFPSPLKLLKNVPRIFFGSRKIAENLRKIANLRRKNFHIQARAVTSATLPSSYFETTKSPAVATDARLAIKEQLNL